MRPKSPLKRNAPDGSETRLHPLRWLVLNAMPPNRTQSDLARAIGCTPQVVSLWLSKAKADRSFRLPAVRARQVAQFFGVRPAYLDPDVFAWHWTEKGADREA